MPAPDIKVFNGQIKTPWRGGYTSEADLTENRIECIEEMDACPFRLIWKNDNLPSFQFIRPGSMLPITSWGLWSGPGESATLLVDLTSEITGKISYFQTTDSRGFRKDYVYYVGALLENTLEAGTYYMRIVSGGVTYYWEPFTVVCETFAEDALPEDVLESVFQSETNPDSQWIYVDDWGLTSTTLVAGAPSNPEWAFEASRVANLGDNFLYTYTGGSWVQSTPANNANLAWFDGRTGAFYIYNMGWQGIPAPVYFEDGKLCWRGPQYFLVGYSIGNVVPCLEERLRIEAVWEVESGGLNMAVEGGDGVGEGPVLGTGTVAFTSYIANGYVLTFNTFNMVGCMTSLRAFCSAGMADCFYRLDWSNCGNVGNTYMGGGFTNSIYLEQAVYPVRPTPDLIVESKTRPDGSRYETRRRRETTWTLDIGMVPWFLADALADISLYDQVVLNPVGGGQDRLSMVRVSVENEEEFAECYKRVVITFQNESATTACCDDFDPPCRASCVRARGLTSHPSPENGLNYLVLGQPKYAVYTDDTFGIPDECSTGLAEIENEEGDVIYSMLFDINEGAWAAVATMVDVAVYPNEDGCRINIIALVASDYRGILQYKNADGEWVDDDQYDLPSSEWIDNNVLRETPADEHADKELRIMVYVGDCEIGHSEVFTYSCA